MVQIFIDDPIMSRYIEVMKFGQILADIRRDLGMTQTIVGDRLGVTASGVAQMESRHELSFLKVIRYLRALGGEVSVKVKFKGAGEGGQDHIIEINLP